MNDPCRQCDNIGERNSFLRQYPDQLSEILADSQDMPLCQPTGDIPHLTEGRLKLLAEATFEGICIHDQGVILDANRQFCDMFGYTSEEIKGMDCFDLIAPRSQEAVRKYISTGFQGPYQAYSLRRHGAIFPVEVRVREFQQDGKILRFAVFRDITEHQEMERQMTESKIRYRQLYHHSPIALYRTRISDGLLLECNQALVELFGYENQDEIRSAGNVNTHYVNRDDRAVFLAKLNKDKRIERFQVQLKHKDGQVLWVEITAEIFPEKGCLEGSMQNITASKVLSRTERKVLRLIVQGRSNKKIAYISNRSTRTIEDHRAHIMLKLGAENLVELIQKAKSLKPES